MDTICISGGGLRGITFIGVLEYLESIKYIDISLINNFVGTSIGSIICFILSLNYTIVELKKFLLYFNFNILETEIDICTLFDNFGINKGDSIILILKNFLFKKYNINDITFKEHFNLTNKKLIIIGTNFTKGTEAIFNYINTPSMSVILALRISLSIPLIFTPVLYESEYYIDGALSNNFPTNHCNLKTTLGIYIKKCRHNNLDNIFSLISGCIKIITDNISLKFNQNTLNIIEICDDYVGMINFNLDINNKLKFIDNGKECAKKYIDNLSFNICNSIINDIINSCFSNT